MTVKGVISGTGNPVTRENEIMPDSVARFRYCIEGHQSGVLYDVGHDFYATVEGFVNGDDDGKTETGRFSNTVHVADGMVFAYGYFGYATAVDITFLPPAVEQWHIIYVELDKSVIPNACTVKVKNNQGSSRILPNTFRQDELSVVKTGVYQLPLWFIRVTNKGIEVEDLRTNEYKNPQNRTYDLRNVVRRIQNVKHADKTSSVLGSLGKNCKGQTLSVDASLQESIKTTVATTRFVQEYIHSEIMK